MHAATGCANRVCGMTFEATALWLTWKISTILSMASILVLGILIIRRAFVALREQAADRKRELFSQNFYAGLGSPIALTADALPELKKSDLPFVVDVALDTLRAVHGRDAERIAEMLVLWEVFPYLREHLKRGRRGVRIQALTLFSYLGDEESYALLFDHAEEDDPYVQLAALRGLAMRAPLEHYDKIFRSLESSVQENALMLADVLLQFGEPALAHLHALAECDRASVQMRLATIRAIGHLGSLPSLDPLVGLLGDKSVQIRAEAALAVGELGDVRAADRLSELLEDKEKQVRISAAKALGVIKARRAMPALVEALGDDEWWVRFHAADALFQLGESGSALLNAVAGQGGHAGLIASQMLAEKEGV